MGVLRLFYSAGSNTNKIWCNQTTFLKSIIFQSKYSSGNSSINAVSRVTNDVVVHNFNCRIPRVYSNRLLFSISDTSLQLTRVLIVIRACLPIFPSGNVSESSDPIALCITFAWLMLYTLYVGFTTEIYIRVAKQRSEGRLRWRENCTRCVNKETNPIVRWGRKRGSHRSFS
jgi:hypothetical protein